MLGIRSIKKSETNGYVEFFASSLVIGIQISIICVLLILFNNIFSGAVAFGWIPCLLVLLYIITTLLFNDVQRDVVGGNNFIYSFILAFLFYYTIWKYAFH